MEKINEHIAFLEKRVEYLESELVAPVEIKFRVKEIEKRIDRLERICKDFNLYETRFKKDT